MKYLVKIFGPDDDDRAIEEGLDYMLKVEFADRLVAFTSDGEGRLIAVFEKGSA